MSALLLAVLGASLVGSLHCVGMCGPFVVFYAGADGSSGAGRWLSHLAYSGGRLLTYAAMGAAAGAVGAAVDLAGDAAEVQRAAALLAGGLIVLWGGANLLLHGGLRLGLGSGKGPAVPKVVSRLAGRIAGRPPVVRALGMGLLTTVLPCGWLYGFVVAAAATGSALAGAAVMVAFWLGTLPALLGLGAGLQRLAAPLRRRLPLLASLLLVVMGVLALSSRVELPGKMVRAARAEDLAAATEQVKALPDAPKPCCAGKKNTPPEAATP